MNLRNEPGVGVLLDVGVLVGVGVDVLVGVAVGVAVRVGVLVRVGVSVLVGVGVAVRVCPWSVEISTTLLANTGTVTKVLVITPPDSVYRLKRVGRSVVPVSVVVTCWASGS